MKKTISQKWDRERLSPGARRSVLYLYLAFINLFLLLIWSGILYPSIEKDNVNYGLKDIHPQLKADLKIAPAGTLITEKENSLNFQDTSSEITDTIHPGFTFYLLLSLIIVFIVLTIISLQKQISKKNKALRMSEEKFRLIFENSPLGIFHFDSSGVITACNTSFEKIIGIDSEKLLGLDTTTLTNIDIVQNIGHVLKGNMATYNDIFICSAPEKSISVRAIMVPLSLKNGRSSGGMGIIEDITLRKIYEERLVQAREDAEKANKIKSIFLANMSHELRTPLNGILGILQILRDSCTEPNLHEYIDIAAESGKRLTRLLSDILDLSKIESEEITLIKENVNIRELITSVLTSLSGYSSQKNNILTYSISDSIPEIITGDELRIRQILQNIVENAVKFTSDGLISIDADFKFHGKSRGELLLKVTDNGIGIEKDKIDAILEPFRQVENTFTRKFQGVGLGLSIVRRLLSLMNGDIRIESIPGNSTVVKCTMQVEIPGKDIDTPVEGQDEEPAIDSSLNILLVEDDRINRLMVQTILEKMNHTVTAASNGLEALDLFHESDFDLILMDIQMPEMNGIEAIKEIRKAEHFGKKNGINVIALTAYAMTGDREKFLEYGFDEYIPKPLSKEMLITTIAGLKKKANLSSPEETDSVLFRTK